LCNSRTAQGSEIYVSTANAAGGQGNIPAAISWTMDAAWTDVDISITFFNLFSYSGVPTGDVYLTNAIGAGTTAAANQIAFTTVTPSGEQFPTITTFSDLSLGPGTYYLLFARQTLGFFWALGDTSNYVVGPGVTAGTTYIGFKDVPLS